MSQGFFLICFSSVVLFTETLSALFSLPTPSCWDFTAAVVQEDFFVIAIGKTKTQIRTFQEVAALTASVEFESVSE